MEIIRASNKACIQLLTTLALTEVDNTIGIIVHKNEDGYRLIETLKQRLEGTTIKGCNKSTIRLYNGVTIFFNITNDNIFRGYTPKYVYCHYFNENTGDLIFPIVSNIQNSLIFINIQ